MKVNRVVFILWAYRQLAGNYRSQLKLSSAWTCVFYKINAACSHSEKQSRQTCIYPRSCKINLLLLATQCSLSFLPAGRERCAHPAGPLHFRVSLLRMRHFRGHPAKEPQKHGNAKKSVANY